MSCSGRRSPFEDVEGITPEPDYLPSIPQDHERTADLRPSAVFS
jgi:hypothetical protein